LAIPKKDDSSDRCSCHGDPCYNVNDLLPVAVAAHGILLDAATRGSQDGPPEIPPLQILGAFQVVMAPLEKKTATTFATEL